MTTVAPREVPLGGLRAMTVRRTLPNRERTTIGAWCFIDHYGPNRITAGSPGMFVAPHPHTGLQTVTWLFSGEVEHRDSVGSRQAITPGAVNLMTAGRGIQHSEVSTLRGNVLHGVQLWVVLPESARDAHPFFEHHECTPLEMGGAVVTVFAGELGNGSAPTTTFTELLGAEITLEAGTSVNLPYRSDFEYGILVDTGAVQVNGENVEAHHLGYVAPQSGELTITANENARIVLLGGVAFTEPIVMWWNFIGRSHEDIVKMRERWQNDVIAGKNPNGEFGSVDFNGGAIPAPELPTVRLKPRVRGGTRAD